MPCCPGRVGGRWTMPSSRWPSRRPTWTGCATSSSPRSPSWCPRPWPPWSRPTPSAARSCSASRGRSTPGRTTSSCRCAPTGWSSACCRSAPSGRSPRPRTAPYAGWARSSAGGWPTRCTARRRSGPPSRRCAPVSTSCWPRSGWPASRSGTGRSREHHRVAGRGRPRPRARRAGQDPGGLPRRDPPGRRRGAQPQAARPARRAGQRRGRAALPLGGRLAQLVPVGRVRRRRARRRPIPLGHNAGRHHAAGQRGRDPAARGDRLADRAGQPAEPAGPARPGPADAAAVRGAAAGPRPVQGGQRHPRPPGRRPAAGRARPAAGRFRGPTAARSGGWAATSSSSSLPGWRPAERPRARAGGHGRGRRAGAGRRPRDRAVGPGQRRHRRAPGSAPACTAERPLPRGRHRAVRREGGRPRPLRGVRRGSWSRGPASAQSVEAALRAALDRGRRAAALPADHRPGRQRGRGPARWAARRWPGWAATPTRRSRSRSCRWPRRPG